MGHTAGTLFALRLYHPQASANTVHAAYFKLKRTGTAKEIRQKSVQKMERAEESYFAS